MIFDICELNKISEDTNIWGGKAVSICELMNNNFCVPKGIVLSTKLFDKYLSKKLNINTLEEELTRICKCYFDYNNCGLIIRSSANIESGKEYSCCGVFDTYVYDPSFSITHFIKKVWDSACSSFAIDYCNKINYPSCNIKMAVIIQEIKKGDYNAVIQTYDIVNHKNRIVLEYSSGDIDSVVNGFLDANTLFIEYEQDSTSFSDVILNKRIIYRLINDCYTAEKVFNSHVELEAQICNNNIFYVQAREI